MGIHVIRLFKDLLILLRRFFWISGILLLGGCGDSVRDSELNIVGGVEDNRSFPPAVGLAIKLAPGWGGFCSATVVRDDLVLTAAHCLVDTQALKVKIHRISGRHGTDPVYHQEVELSEATRLVPQGYRSGQQTFSSDVAFVVFPKGSFSPKEIASIAKVPPQIGDVVRLVGIGQTSVFDHSSNPEFKRFSGSNIIEKIDRDAASAIYLKSEKVGMDDAGAAPGDSGGPLVNRAGELIGVASGVSWSPSDPITSNVSINSQRPLNTIYVNLTDPFVAAFIDGVLSRTPSVWSH